MVNFTMLAYRRPRLTRQALDSLDDTSGMNCIVRDQYSDDKETLDVTEDWSKKNSIRGRVTYHATLPAGTGAARNDVIQASQQAFGRGDFLYLSDNDVFFYPAFMGQLINCYEEAWKYGFRVLGAYNHPYHQPIDGEQRVKVGNCEVYPVMALALQSMLMSWDVWDKYGPFCETPEGKVCQGEDVDFTNKIRADGGRLGVVSPPLLVNTGITNSFGEKIPGWEMVKAQCPAGVICE